jgi:hypothetical protein
MKKIPILFVLLYSISGFSQDLNNYKYIIVPAKFKFLKESDQYHLNSITKLYLQNYGFETYFDTDQLPTELADRNCNKLFIDIDENSSMFSTKIKINFKDCKGIILYSSAEGSSRDKEYSVAYNEAFRIALKSIASANYKFKENSKIISAEISTSENTKIYSAVAITDGYDLVDDNKQVVFKILKTSTSDLFLAQSFDKNGVLIKKGENYIFEYYKNDNLVSEKVKVKF